MSKKISIIGTGNIGGTLALLLTLQKIEEIVLLDINEGAAKGKALDIKQTSRLTGSISNIYGTSNYNDIKGSDVIVVTAGIARKPGMSRDDLVSTNAKVVFEVGKNITKYCPDAFVICVTNPLDAMVWVLQKSSGLPTNRVVGMAGVLDSSRFATFLAEALNVDVNNIDCFVLGGHGDNMVPVLGYVSVEGLPLKHFIDTKKITQEKIDSIVERTKYGGGEIVKLLGNGSAFYAPACSALEMANAYMYNQNKIIPAAVYVEGKYGIDGMYVGLPCVIDGTGVKEILEIELDKNEVEDLKHSVEGVQKLIDLCKDIVGTN